MSRSRPSRRRRNAHAILYATDGLFFTSSANSAKFERALPVRHRIVRFDGTYSLVERAREPKSTEGSLLAVENRPFLGSRREKSVTSPSIWIGSRTTYESARWGDRVGEQTERRGRVCCSPIHWVMQNWQFPGIPPDVDRPCLNTPTRLY